MLEQALIAALMPLAPVPHTEWLDLICTVISNDSASWEPRSGLLGEPGPRRLRCGLSAAALPLSGSDGRIAMFNFSGGASRGCWRRPLPAVGPTAARRCTHGSLQSCPSFWRGTTMRLY